MIELTAAEARVLGCLIEKSVTTRDAYPLSLNSLRLACNQTTNRDPILHYDDTTVEVALDGLRAKQLARRLKSPGERVIKHRHIAPETLEAGDAALGILCVLLLRGPQTPGELKQRTDRLHAFADLDQIEATLSELADRKMVGRLARRPGQKEARWRELFTPLGERHDAVPIDDRIEEHEPEEPIAATLQISDAHTGEVVRNLAVDTEHDVVAKLHRARRAAAAWAARSRDDRVAILLESCARLGRAAGELVGTAARETGRAEGALRADLAAAIDRLVRALDSPEDAPADGPGVTAVIADALRCFSIDVVGAALTRGNAVLYKPASSATLTGLALVDLLHGAGVPEDVAQCVVGAAPTGAEAVRCGADLVLFHGTHGTGAKAALIAGERSIPIELSLRAMAPLSPGSRPG